MLLLDCSSSRVINIVCAGGSFTPAPGFTGCRATTFTVQVCMYTTVLSCAHLVLKVRVCSGSQEELHHLLVAIDTGLL